MKPRYDSYCGLYCGACPVHMATVNGTAEEKGKAWDVDAKEIVCNGCKTRTIAKICQDCVMRLCARDRGLDFCGDCDEYPCASFQVFHYDRFPHHTLVAPNVAAICELGVETWLEQQKERWSCPKCGTPFTWYEEECRNCGEKLYDACAEEDDWADEQARAAGGSEGLYWKMRKNVRRFR
jgi:predicted RNA-binding Zn-ribbon protein involved in translation (DUF1610 family)